MGCLPLRGCLNLISEEGVEGSGTLLSLQRQRQPISTGHEQHWPIAQERRSCRALHAEQQPRPCELCIVAATRPTRACLTTRETCRYRYIYVSNLDDEPGCGPAPRLSQQVYCSGMLAMKRHATQGARHIPEPVLTASMIWCLVAPSFINLHICLSDGVYGLDLPFMGLLAAFSTSAIFAASQPISHSDTYLRTTESRVC